MSGKPAARMGDAVAYGVIVQGSATVLIGSQGGIACSVCPGGMAVGNPVNPALGAKVLADEIDLDFALPGALPVAWQRQYSSYVNHQHGPRLGMLGFGWTLPFEIAIQLTETACRLFDSSGRVIDFDPIAPGAALYSPSEDIWLLRGGPDLPQRLTHAIAVADDRRGNRATPAPSDQVAYAARWRALTALATEQLADPGHLFATSGGTIWIFHPHDSGRHELAGLVDRYGRRQHHTRIDTRLSELRDGVGRRYRLRYDAVHAGRPADGPWPADPGLRLVGVDLVADPLAPGAPGCTLVSYRYSPEGDLIGVLDRHGEETRRFAYVGHSLVFHRHRQGPEHRYRYESNRPGARVLEQHNQDGLSYHFDYRDTDNAVFVTDSLGRIDRYQFRGEGGLKRLIEHTRPDGSVLRYDYDAAGRLVARTDPLGHDTYFRLDGEGRLLGMQEADGGSRSHAHDAAGQVIETVSPAGRRTRYQYDPRGRIVQIEAADGSQTRYRYPDPESDAALTCEYPVEIVDARGGHKKLSWTGTGQLAAYTDCSGRTTRYRYDRWGHLVETADPLGHLTRYQRDPQGRLVTLVRADGSLSRYRYDRDRLVAEHDALGRVTDYGYDLWGRLTSRRRGGAGLGLDYDSAGRLVALTNENGSQTRFVYDALDRLTREVGFDQRARNYQYDAAGRLLAAGDGDPAHERLTLYAYDRADRLIERRAAGTEHAPGELHRFDYDRDGLLRKAGVFLLPDDLPRTAPDDTALVKSSEVELERDALGRPVRETQRLYHGVGALEFEYAIRHRYTPLGHRAASETGMGELNWLSYGSGHIHGLSLDQRMLLDLDRDAGHREIARRFANGIAETRQLDPLGRLLDQGFGPALAARRYAYDAAGQMLGIRTGHLTTVFAYDPQGRLVASRVDRAAEVRYRFDPAGNRLPDPLPDAIRPEDWAQRVRTNLPDPNFNVIAHEATQSTLPDVARWPQNRIGHHAGTRYAYDAWGNRAEAHHPDHTRTRYAYDGLHRLIALATPDSVTRYRYDAFGRRLAKEVTQAGIVRTTWFGWDGDRLTRIEDADSARETVYDPASFAPMLLLERNKGGPSAVDALLSATMAPESVEADQARTLLAAIPREMRDTLEAALRAIPDADLPPTMRAALPPDFDTREAEHALRLTKETLARQTPPTRIRYFHCDHLGTPFALSDEQGNLLWQARFDPWGNLIEEHAELGIVQPFRFQGQFFDQESGLHYNRHRYYDPMLGAYISQDPIGLRGGHNKYSYVNGNPFAACDPWGLIDLKVPDVSVTIHANPGPEATDFRPDHEPAHVHLLIRH